MTRKLLALLLACLLASVSAVGLAQDDAEQILAKTQLTTTVQKLTDEPATLSLWADISNNGAIGTLLESMNDMDLLAVMEEKTGVHIECVNPPVGEAETAFSLLLAGGRDSYPDIILGFAGYYPYGGDAAIEEGIIYDLNTLLQFAPNYTAELEKSDFRKLNSVTDKGNMPYVQKLTLNDRASINFGGAVIRQDLLNKLGVEMPDTYDEVHDFLARCVSELGLKRALALDYNGSSKYDGLTAGYGFHLKNSNLTNAFYLADGTMTYAPLTEGYKSYVTMMSQWYAEGLVDPDFSSVRTFDDGVALATGGQCAVLSDHGGILEMYNGLGKAADENFQLVAMPIPVPNEGDMVHNGSSSGTPVSNVAAISTGCDNPELAMRYIDQWYTDEGFLLTNYGTLDKTYTLVDGMPVYTDMIMNNPDVDSVAAMSAYSAPIAWFHETVSNRDISESTRVMAKIWDANNDSAGMIPSAVALNAEENEAYGDVYSDIETYVDEMTVRFIMGLEPLENYDAFVEQLYAMDVEAALGAYQSAYDRYISR